MKIPRNFLKSVFTFFILSFFTVLILGWQFAPEAESAVQNAPDKEKLENYDIRTDKSEPARAALGKFAAEAGMSDAQIADARKLTLEAAERLRSGGGNLQIEFNEDLRVPEVISPVYDGKADFLTVPSGRKRTEILENFLLQNSGLFGINGAQISGFGQPPTTRTRTAFCRSFISNRQSGNPVFAGSNAGYPENESPFSYLADLIRN